MSVGPTDCPVCYKQYNRKENEPKMMLCCGHTVCSPCLQMILQKTRQCPLDRKVFDILHTNVDHFPRNAALLELIETHEQSEKHDICLKHGERQTFMCYTDLIKICGRCYHAEHRGNHKVEHIEDINVGIKNKTGQLTKLRTAILENQKEVNNQVDCKRNALNESIKVQFKQIHQELDKVEEDLSKELGICFNRKKLKLQEKTLKDYPSVNDLDHEVKILNDFPWNKKFFDVLSKDGLRDMANNLKKKQEECLIEEFPDFNKTIEENFGNIRASFSKTINHYKPAFIAKTFNLPGVLAAGSTYSRNRNSVPSQQHVEAINNIPNKILLQRKRYTSSEDESENENENESDSDSDSSDNEIKSGFNQPLIKFTFVDR